MKKFWTIYTVLCCIFCCEMASAQNLTKISGTVLDENNAPMAGHLVDIGRNIYAHQRTDRSNHFFLIYRLRNRKSNRKQPQNRRSHTTRSRRKLHARNYRRRLRKAGAPRHHRLGIIGQARRAEIVLVGRPTATRPCTRRIRK